MCLAYKTKCKPSISVEQYKKRSSTYTYFTTLIQYIWTIVFFSDLVSFIMTKNNTTYHWFNRHLGLFQVYFGMSLCVILMVPTSVLCDCRYSCGHWLGLFFSIFPIFLLVLSGSVIQSTLCHLNFTIITVQQPFSSLKMKDEMQTYNSWPVYVM